MKKWIRKKAPSFVLAGSAAIGLWAGLQYFPSQILPQPPHPLVARRADSRRAWQACAGNQPGLMVDGLRCLGGATRNSLMRSGRPLYAFLHRHRIIEGAVGFLGGLWLAKLLLWRSLLIVRWLKQIIWFAIRKPFLLLTLGFSLWGYWEKDFRAILWVMAIVSMGAWITYILFRRAVGFQKTGP